MAFPLPYRQAGQPSELPQPAFSCQHTSSTPRAYLDQSQAPISVSQNGIRTSQPQNLATSQSHPDQTLKRQLDSALRKIREHEDRSEEHTSELQSRENLVC